MIERCFVDNPIHRASWGQGNALQHCGARSRHDFSVIAPISPKSVTAPRINSLRVGAPGARTHAANIYAMYASRGSTPGFAAGRGTFTTAAVCALTIESICCATPVNRNWPGVVMRRGVPVKERPFRLRYRRDRTNVHNIFLASHFQLVRQILAGKK